MKPTLHSSDGIWTDRQGSPLAKIQQEASQACESIPAIRIRYRSLAASSCRYLL
jgi:hypothetical protein